MIRNNFLILAIRNDICSNYSFMKETYGLAVYHAGNTSKTLAFCLMIKSLYHADVTESATCRK